MTKFENIIECKCTTDSDKLTYLEQYTTGQAQKLVQSCCNYDSTVAYSKAKQLLLSEYGNEFKVSNSYIESLNNWPVIKSEDSSALQ